MSVRPVTHRMPEGLLGAVLVALLCALHASAAAQTPAPAAAPGAAADAGARAEPPSPAGAPDVSLQQAPPPAAPDAGGHPTALKYQLQRVEIIGNRNTKQSLIKKFVPVEIGSTFDVADPELEALRYRLLGTGWYDRVDLKLKRGDYPGWAVLVIEVEERSTLVFQQLTAGVGWSVEHVDPSDGPGAGPSRKPEPYLGLALAETNFLGTGKTVGGEVLVARDQQGLALVYHDPVVRSSNWGLRTRATFVNGQEYFGGDKNVQVAVDCRDAEELGRKCQATPDAAVVDYWRAGLSLGTARDVGSFTRLTLDWRGDYVYVPSWGLPAAATEQRGRGSNPRAIDFAIEPYSSIVSMLSVGFIYDKRDSAILPTRGLLASFSGDLASRLIASDYEFVRLQTNIGRWFPLSWGHTIRVGAFAGAVFSYAPGGTPFFYKFFVSDLTDLQPSRILGLNLDHRPAPNLFGVLSGCKPFDSACGTAIAQMRQEELAARVDVEYVWPVVRGRRKFLKNADAYFLLGVYGLADPRDLQVAIPGYSGIARLPIDLTLDLGMRLDTQMGVFQVGLAKFVWLPMQ